VSEYSFLTKHQRIEGHLTSAIKWYDG